MKRILKIILPVFLVLLIAQSCTEDGTSDGPPPTGENVTSEIMASPGDQILFEGTFESEVGFKHISLVNTDMMLDKQIVFANEVKKYFLEYTFTVQDDTPFNIYEVMITAEDLNGELQEHTVMVDIATEPGSEDMTLNFDASPGDDITITGTITDEQGISTISLMNTGIGLEHIIEPEGNPTLFDLNYTYSIPAGTPQAVHNGTVSITNVANRTTTYDMAVNLTGEEVTYDNIYVAGSFQWWPWRPDLAFPMDPDPENEGWFETSVHAWDEFDELKFLAQLDWEPDNWGLVDQNDPSQGMLNSNDSEPVLLGANGGNPAYKKVRFNPYREEYTVEDLTETIEPRTEMYIMGTGFPQYPDLDWNPEAAIPMTQNPDGYGEHIFMIEGLEFSDAVDLKFIGQTDGWGPYDAGFAVDEQQVTAPVSWVQVEEGSGTADLKFTDQAGTYTVLFDYYLKRALIWKEE